jgi:hypothetical protein
VPSVAAGARLARMYSLHADKAATTTLADLDPAKLIVEPTANKKTPLQPEKLVFGHSFTGA